MTPAAPPWLSAFNAALHAEYQDRPRIAALATVDADHRPHVRHVVVRQVTDAGHLLIASDARSAKNEHVRHSGAAEIAFYLPTLRLQFRLAGHVHILSDATTLRPPWRQLTDPSRAKFFWPAPGSPRSSSDTFPAAITPDTPPPPSFEVLALIPGQMDHLDLNPIPHRRFRYRLESGWLAEEINP